MAETITLGRLDGEVRQALAAAGIDPRHAAIVLHKPLEREHAKNRRRYAQVIPDELRFEFATATLALDPEHRTALVAHEVGHCIAWREKGRHSEDDADEAAERVLGIPICYDLDWPGKGLQVICQAETIRAVNPRPSKHGWPKKGRPPVDPRDYVLKSQIDAWYRGQYVQDGRVIASSRTTKADYPRYELGTWKIDDQFRGMYGHEIDELVLVDDPRVLEPGEFDWADPTKMLRQSGKLEDMQRYADWMAEGHNYPPIHVVETERGTLRITDGHRRAAAAESKGMPIKAWISWLTDHPDPPPNRDMKVGLTYELATGQEWTMPRAANPKRRNISPSEMTTEQIMARIDELDALGNDKTDAQYDEISVLVDEVMRRDSKNPKRKRNAAKGPPFTPSEGAEIFDAIHQCAHKIADNSGADAVIENYYDNDAPEADSLSVKLKFVPRVPKQRHLTLVENPKGFSPSKVEEIREDFQGCVGRFADTNRLTVQYESAKPTPKQIPMRMKVTRRPHRQADLFGNPRRLKRPTLVGHSSYKGHDFHFENHYPQKWDDGVTRDTYWLQVRGPDLNYEEGPFSTTTAARRAALKEIDAAIGGRRAKSNPPAADRARFERLTRDWDREDWESFRYYRDEIGESGEEARRLVDRDRTYAREGGEKSVNPDLKFDGPTAKRRYNEIVSRKLRPSDAMSDAKTGAYMALLFSPPGGESDAEIFHIDRDGFVYVIAYDDAAEAKDDYDYLVGKFPKLMNPRRKNPGARTTAVLSKIARL